MERVSGDGERREVSPSEIAQMDQLEARFNQFTFTILGIREQIRQAAVKDETAALGSLTAEMERLCREQFPDAKPDELSYMMFLIAMIEDARLWTEYNFDAIDMVIRQLGAVARPGHPLWTLPGFDRETLDRDLEAAIAAVRTVNGGKDTFVTTTGVVLENVHEAKDCEGPFCVIHKPAPGPWDTWDIHWRDDWRLMVRICPHYVHHVAVEEMLRIPVLGMAEHGHPSGCECACDFFRCTTITDDQGNITGFLPNG